jgi:hypothetical protein
MATVTIKSFQQARALSAEQRVLLAEALLESLHRSDPDQDKLLLEEGHQRIAAFVAGQMETCSAEEVLRDLDEMLRERRQP